MKTKYGESFLKILTVVELNCLNINVTVIAAFQNHSQIVLHQRQKAVINYDTNNFEFEYKIPKLHSYFLIF